MCGYFSEMVYSESGRKSFIESCVQLMKKYPWLAGIDIDWEYPGGDGKGERRPDGPWEEANPIWESSRADKDNFTKLINEMRAAFNAQFTEHKYITACAAGFKAALVNQDWLNLSKTLDYINIMTYDLMWLTEGLAGHASGVMDTGNIIEYFRQENVPLNIINIGSPFYGTACKLQSGFESGAAVVGSKITDEPVIDKDKITVDYIKRLKAKLVDAGESGWHDSYDETSGGAYMYNDDSCSNDYRTYISYESACSLDGKIKLIEEYNLAGIIVWECTHDTAEHDLSKYIYEGLNKGIQGQIDIQML